MTTKQPSARAVGLATELIQSRNPYNYASRIDAAYPGYDAMREALRETLEELIERMPSPWPSAAAGVIHRAEDALSASEPTP